jgi:hypothetical protein
MIVATINMVVATGAYPRTNSDDRNIKSTRGSIGYP